MCGITGFWDFSNKFSQEQAVNIINNMLATINHRGPDGNGYWQDSNLGVNLGHCRLAILDLSKTGAQPMQSHSGRFILSYNGEIYNELLIKQQLITLGHKFKGTSDTEVLIQAIEEWGLVNTVNKLIGMFAFVLWDRELKTISLVRDRLGVKPLYYGIINNILFFGSELKSLREHPAWLGKLEQNALVGLVKFNYIPAPYSIFKDIFKLEPATILTIDRNKNINKTVYWGHKDIITLDKFSDPESVVFDNLENLLTDAVKIRTLSDVPIGAFLSGGVDSSLVVALMQKISNQPVKTFTIGFNEKNYNEAHIAKLIASYLGTDHQELIVEQQQAIDVIPKLAYIYDEPFADSSQIPTILVSQLAKQKVTVVLSGDGGDELFAGYNRYFLWNNIFNKISWLPRKLRLFLANLILNMPSSLLNYKYTKLAKVLPFNDNCDFYNKIVSNWSDVSPLLDNIDNNLLNNNYIDHSINFTETMQYWDLINYLPDDILVKVDRASMANSLEARGPFLDHRVVEFAWRLPFNFKIRHGQLKWILKQLLVKYLPKSIIDRPKMGFGVPIDHWLRHDLRAWATDLLSSDSLRRQGIFNSVVINQKLKEHLSGVKNNQHELWSMLMVQGWLKYWQVG